MLALVDTELECGPRPQRVHVFIWLGTCNVPALGGCWESSRRNRSVAPALKGFSAAGRGPSQTVMVSLVSLTVVTHSLWAPLGFT